MKWFSPGSHYRENLSWACIKLAGPICHQSTSGKQGEKCDLSADKWRPSTAHFHWRTFPYNFTSFHSPYSISLPNARKYTFTAMVVGHISSSSLRSILTFLSYPIPFLVARGMFFRDYEERRGSKNETRIKVCRRKAD